MVCDVVFIIIIVDSTMRDVPDNQEVFVHNTTDQSIIIEILQFIDEDDDDALR